MRPPYYLYMISHRFVLATTPYKGKSKGKKNRQHDITSCGNRETVIYVRIYYTGRISEWTSIFTMKTMVFGMNYKAIKKYRQF